MPKGSFEVIIIGAGPAASSSAMHLLQRGIRPLIVERERFPRYHISESLTGECGNCLREPGLEAYMHECDYPVKYGLTVWGTGGKNTADPRGRTRLVQTRRAPCRPANGPPERTNGLGAGLGRRVRTFPGLLRS